MEAQHAGMDAAQGKQAVPAGGPPPMAGGAFDEIDSIFPTITPGLIISSLPPARAVEVAAAVERLDEDARSPRSAKMAARSLLRLLDDAELRRLARAVGMPADGPFIALYHRLALMC